MRQWPGRGISQHVIDSYSQFVLLSEDIHMFDQKRCRMGFGAWQKPQKLEGFLKVVHRPSISCWRGKQWILSKKQVQNIRETTPTGFGWVNWSNLASKRDKVTSLFLTQDQKLQGNKPKECSQQRRAQRKHLPQKTGKTTKLGQSLVKLWWNLPNLLAAQHRSVPVRVQVCPEPALCLKTPKLYCSWE